MPARMEVIAFLVPWLLIGIGVFFVAFSGGPGRAREAYLTRGRTFFRIAIPLIYIGLGLWAAFGGADRRASAISR